METCLFPVIFKISARARALLIANAREKPWSPFSFALLTENNVKFNVYVFQS